jgi:hypothetical protein
MNDCNVGITQFNDIYKSRRVQLFRERFGDGHFYLACHAALPLSLTPELLYCLWANFQRDIHGEHLNIPWIAVSDLLLSGLCDEVGNELYEIDAAIRDELIDRLRQDLRFGSQRLHDLATFLLVYLTPQLDSPDLDIQDLAKTQKWSALASLNPNQAAQEIASTLARLNLSDKTEWIRMASIVNILEKPLGDFQPLILYTYAMADYSRGNFLDASAKFKSIHVMTDTTQVDGASLSITDLNDKIFSAALNRNWAKVIELLRNTYIKKKFGILGFYFAVVLTLIFLISAGIFYIFYPFFFQSKPSQDSPNTQRSVESRLNSDYIPSLVKAKLYIIPGDATSHYVAILKARKIASTTPESRLEVQKAIDLWSAEIYQIAQGYANKKRWQAAIEIAVMVPEDATTYAAAQNSMLRWQMEMDR